MGIILSSSYNWSQKGLAGTASGYLEKGPRGKPHVRVSAL